MSPFICFQLRPSTETLHESLFEGQDDGDSLSEETTLLPRLEQEDTQSALLPFTKFSDGSKESQDHDLSETQAIFSPEKAMVPEVEEEKIIASDSFELSQVSWTQNTNHEISPASENVIEKCPAMESEEEARADQNLDPPAAIPTSKGEPPAATCSNSQSFVASLQTKISAKTDFIVKESSPSTARNNSLHQPLIARPLTQTKVLELKKRFEP